jgi:hypothetical protein
MKSILILLLATLVSCNLKSTSNDDSSNQVDVLNQKESEMQNKGNNDLGELIVSANIGVKANQEELKDFEDGIIPWISIENPEKEIDRLIDADKIVIQNAEAILNIDYPLNNPASFILKSEGSGFTTKQLVLEVSKKYHEVYNEEEKSAKTKTIPVTKREGLINRNETDGKYGIWGHDMGDLDLSSIEVYKTKDGKIQIVLGIES